MLPFINSYLFLECKQFRALKISLVVVKVFVPVAPQLPVIIIFVGCSQHMSRRAPGH